MFKNFLIFILFFMPFSALAHSPLASLLPPDGASLGQTPSQIEMVFKLPAKLIKVEMRRLTAKSNGSFLRKLIGSREGD